MARTGEHKHNATLPDYGPDAKRIPPGKLQEVLAEIRATRDRLGLSNEELGREVRKLTEMHNAVPGRKQVVIYAAWADKSDGERCNNELQSIGKGTRKYLVGYLAWICMRDEAAARKLYQNVGRAFLPNPITSELLNQPDAKPEVAQKDLFYVYEAAFLWFDHEPPSILDHHGAMTPEIAMMKGFLHKAFELELLEGVHMNVPSGGYTRMVTRQGLLRFAEATGSIPKFLSSNSKLPPDSSFEILARVGKHLEELTAKLADSTE